MRLALLTTLALVAIATLWLIWSSWTANQDQAIWLDQALREVHEIGYEQGKESMESGPNSEYERGLYDCLEMAEQVFQHEYIKGGGK